MRIYPEVWIFDTRGLDPEAKLTYLEIAMTCSEDRARGAEFDSDLLRSMAQLHGRRFKRVMDDVEELADKDFIQRTDSGWRFFVIEELSRWLRCGLPRWYGSVVLFEIRPAGLDDAGRGEGRREPISARLRSEVIERDGMVCGICREPIDGPLHIDHIHPVARGGATVLENLQPAHPSCNLRKGARVMEGA